MANALRQFPSLNLCHSVLYVLEKIIINYATNFSLTISVSWMVCRFEFCKQNLVLIYCSLVSKAKQTGLSKMSLGESLYGSKCNSSITTHMVNYQRVYMGYLYHSPSVASLCFHSLPSFIYTVIIRQSGL